MVSVNCSMILMIFSRRTKFLNISFPFQVVKRSQPTRPSSATTASSYIRNTPTDLYQNYQKEWSRFKHLLPGESPRSNERQIIRKRMETIQKPQPKPKVSKTRIRKVIVSERVSFFQVFVLMNDDNTKVIRREMHQHR